MELFFAEYITVLKELHQNFIATFDDLPDEALDWVPGEDMNSFTVLVVHTTASARFWMGDVGMGEPSNRDRDAEFRAKGLTKSELKTRFAVLESYLSGAFEHLTLSDLAISRAIPDDAPPKTAAYALMRALQHVGLHLGHAQITRQLWQQKTGSS